MPPNPDRPSFNTRDQVKLALIMLLSVTACSSVDQATEANEATLTQESADRIAEYHQAVRQAVRDYYVPEPGVMLPPTPSVNFEYEDGKKKWKPNDPNTIYQEFSGLDHSQILNKAVKLFKQADKRFGFPFCDHEKLSGTFLPSNEYLNLDFIDDHDTGMIIIENSELHDILFPWEIDFPSTGRLELSEAQFVGEIFVRFYNREIMFCYGGPSANEIVMYGDLQKMFDQLYQRYSDTVYQEA